MIFDLFKEEVAKKKVAVVMITSKGRTLIMRRTKTAPTEPLYWTFPGGHIDAGESPEDAALREVKEETDLNLHKQGLQKLGSFDEGDTLIHMYHYEITNPKVRILDQEHDCFAWILPYEVVCYQTTPLVKKLVTQL